MIGVRCDRCGAHFWAKDETAGRSASCARCGQILRIPAPPEESEPAAPRAVRDPSPRPEPSESPNLWLPRESAGEELAGSLRELLKVARQIRLLLAILIVIVLVLWVLLVAG